jgi:hypothetical protein|tara:strand:+ start:564 stop:848 length:285 start_codon:yes stop_codon:yes gene_type:complete
MSKELNENTAFNLSVKTIISIGAAMVAIISMWFVLQADIQEAKELPAPSISRMEFDLKDELIRQTIMDTQRDVEDVLKSLEKMEKRLYEIKSKR